MRYLISLKANRPAVSALLCRIVQTVKTETLSEWILRASDINVAAASSEYHNTDVSSRLRHGNLPDDQLLNSVSLQHFRPHRESCHKSFNTAKIHIFLVS